MELKKNSKIANIDEINKKESYNNNVKEFDKNEKRKLILNTDINLNLKTSSFENLDINKKNYKNSEKEFFLVSNKNLNLKFPYKPQNNQIKSILKLNEAFENINKRILFECENAYDKIQILLTTIFNYKTKNNLNIKILYFKKTINGINNVLSKAKNNYFKIIGSVLNSKKKLCLDKKYESYNKNNCFCEEEGYQFKIDDIEELVNYNKCLNIDDLKNICFKYSICPYYLSLYLIKKDDLIVLPYNYLIDPILKESIKDLFNDSIIVFDDCYDIEKIFAESSSCDFDYYNLEKFLNVIKRLIINENSLFGNDDNNNIIILEKMHQIIKNLLSLINHWKSENINGKYQHGEVIKKIIDLKGIKNNEIEILIEYLNKSEPKNFLIKKFLFSFKYFFNICENEKNQLEKFKVILDINKKIHIICVSPSKNFKDITNLEPNKIIFTSNNLKPFKNLENSLNKKFDFTYSCEIDQSNMKKTLKCIRLDNYFKFNNSQELTFTRNHKNELNNINSFFNFIGKINNPKTGGVLVYLPNYNLLEKFKIQYNNIPLIKGGMGNTKIIFESRLKNSQSQFENYKNSCKRHKAVFFIVFNGQFSEGFNFKDDLARMIFILGIPFSDIYSLKVQSKKKYLEKNLNIIQNKNSMNFKEWYKLQALKKINYIAGKIKTHIQDYGIIILVDSRFKNINYEKFLDENLKNNIIDPKSYLNFHNILDGFFSINKKISPNLHLKMKEDLLNEDNDFLIIECIICYEKKKRNLFKKAKCNHKACIDCWKKCLKEKLECMICKSRVRMKTLKIL